MKQGLCIFITRKRSTLVVQNLILEDFNHVFDPASIDSGIMDASPLENDVNEGLANESVASVQAAPCFHVF